MNNTPANNLNLKAFFDLFWAKRLLLLLITVGSAIISVAYALYLPNLYKSHAVLEHVRESENELSGLSQLGQLASMTGFSIPGQGGTDTKSVDIALIQSHDFLAEFIQKSELVVPLFAAKEWEAGSDKVILDETIYDENTTTWTREVKAPFKPEPSAQESVEAFKEIFAIEVDRVTGLVNVSVEFYSPVLAKQWLDSMLREFNEFVRQQDTATYDKHLDYLEVKAEELRNSEMRNVLYSLIEQEQKKAMLAHVSNDYVFRIIESPLVSIRKDSPKRALICITGTIGGFFIGMLVIFLTALYKEE